MHAGALENTLEHHVTLESIMMHSGVLDVYESTGKHPGALGYTTEYLDAPGGIRCILEHWQTPWRNTLH